MPSGIYLGRQIMFSLSRLFCSSSGIVYLALLTLLVFLTFTFLTGPVHSIDTQSYSRWADLLISTRFNLDVYFTEIANLPSLRIVFISFVALLKLGFGAYWTTIFVMVNCLSISISGYMLMRILQIDNRGTLEIAFIFLVNILLYERFFWSRYILSDTSFCLISTALLYFLYRSSRRSKYSHLHVILSLGICGVACLYRPTGVVLFPMFVAGLVFSFTKNDRLVVTKLIVLLIPILGMIVLIVWAWYMNSPALWDESKLSRILARAHYWFNEGAVVKKRFHTYLPNPKTALDIFAIEMARLTQYFRFTTPMFSSAHNIVNVISFIPLYSLGLVGIWRVIILLYRHNQPDYIGILSIIFIVSFAVFHSMFLIDYDWRYRLPCYPPIFLLAAGGVTFIRNLVRHPV